MPACCQAVNKGVNSTVKHNATPSQHERADPCSVQKPTLPQVTHTRIPPLDSCSMVWKFVKRTRIHSQQFDDSVFIDGSSSFSESEIPADDFARYSSAASSLKAAAAKPVSERKPRSMHVAFSDVQTRHYRRILGDNPYATVPLALGWDFESTSWETVDEHEARIHGSSDYKCAQQIQPLERNEREALLIRAGYSRKQIELEERRRRITLLIEWSYRQNRDESVVYSCAHGPDLFKRYIM